MITQLLNQLNSAQRTNAQLEQQLLRRLYGRSSEKIDPAQQVLFAELLQQLQAQSAGARCVRACHLAQARQPQRPRPAPASGRPAARAGRCTTCRERREALPLLRDDAGDDRRGDQREAGLRAGQGQGHRARAAQVRLQGLRGRPPRAGRRSPRPRSRSRPSRRAWPRRACWQHVIVSKYCRPPAAAPAGEDPGPPRHRHLPAARCATGCAACAEALRPLYELMVQEVLGSQGDPHRRHAGGRAGPQARARRARGGSGSTAATTAHPYGRVRLHPQPQAATGR